MRYDYLCKGKCKKVVEVEKKMADPDPAVCPFCNSKKITRYWGPASIPGVLYPGRPIWTYNDTKKYKTFRQNGGTLKKVNSKHGDLGAWHTDAEIAPEPKKKGRKK